MTYRVLSYGGGVNSKGLLAGMVERAMSLDAIVFSDTGGELPETYHDIEQTSRWAKSRGYPEIIVVRNSGETLEQNCLRRKTLPAIAFGYKTCSQRWKRDPFSKWANNYAPLKALWDGGDRAEKLIGFDADEPHRATSFEDKKFVARYYLIEWGWGRDECVDAIRRAGLPVPSKSACFFCPNRSDSEFRAMREQHPEYLARAMAMEDNATLTDIKGLKRDYSLRQLLANEELFGFTAPQPCDCYDG